MNRRTRRFLRHPRYYVWVLIGIALAAAAGVLTTVYLSAVDQQRQADQLVKQAAEQRQLAQAAVEARRNAPVYIQLPGATQITALRDDYDQAGSLWALANKERSIGTDYVPAGLTIPNVPVRPNATTDERSVRQVVVQPLSDLFAAAKVQGYNLMIGSAYRSAGTQTSLFNTYVASAGLAKAQQYSARPGHSEHQLGLAVDISTVSQACYLDECFLGTPEGTWLSQNAYKYGFTLRYKKGKEAITGYNFEPWHYRYVGMDLAAALYQSNLTLEEAWPVMIQARDTLRFNRAI